MGIRNIVHIINMSKISVVWIHMSMVTSVSPGGV